MKLLHGVIALLAYVTVLVQVGVLAEWPPFGAQPHLIALGTTVFLVIGRHDLGFVWMLIGAGLIDLLLPVRFGLTLVPLVAAYAVLSVILRRFVDEPSWLGTIALGLILLLAAELPLAIIYGGYRQLLPDLVLGLMLLLPVAALATHPLRLRRLGLSIR